MGRAPRSRGRVWAEEPLLGHQVLLGIHQVPHVVIFQQRTVEGAVQRAGGAQVFVLGRRETAWQPLSPAQCRKAPRGQGLTIRQGLGSEARTESSPSPPSVGVCFLVTRRDGVERPRTWMTTKRWGSLAMRENSATSSRNRGRHSESIIQPGAGRSSASQFCLQPVCSPTPFLSGLV